MKISPLDAILFKGILQIPISLIAVWRRRHKSKSKVDIASSDTKKEGKSYHRIDKLNLKLGEDNT